MDGQKTNKLSDDHLSNTVSLRARITETDLSFSAKSRAIAALDRLIGATVDIPASMMEAWANKRRVAMQAAENLVSSSSEPEPEPDAKEVNPDWLNYFGGYAEKASSKNVRDLWGRVLAGEIRRPTSFSLTTLRILAELDQQIASLFEDVVRFRIDGKYILRPTADEWNSGEFEKFKLLEEVGLVEDANPFINTSYVTTRASYRRRVRRERFEWPLGDCIPGSPWTGGSLRFGNRLRRTFGCGSTRRLSA